MKKRKELDALIGNRAKRDNQVNGQLEYDSLNSSLSSPTADVYMPPTGYYSSSKRISRSSAKGCGCTLRKMIRICLPVCFLSLVAACITACIGIVWMQVQLKTDVERLKERVIKLETWQGEQPSALSDMQKTVSRLNNVVTQLKDGDTGVRSLGNKIAHLEENFEEKVNAPAQKLGKLEIEIVDLKSDIGDLKTASDQAKSKIEPLETGHEMLSASFTELKSSVDSIKTETSDANVKQLKDIASSKRNAEVGISQINSTLQKLSLNLTVLEAKVTDLKRNTENDVNHMKQDVNLIKKDKTQKDTALVNLSSEITRLKSQVSQVLSDINNNKSENKGSNDRDNPDGSNLNAKKHRSGQQTKPQSSMTITDLARDILQRFEAIDSDGNGVLSQSELIAKYGSNVAQGFMQQDSNHDGVISKTEATAFLSAVQQPSKKNDR